MDEGEMDINKVPPQMREMYMKLNYEGGCEAANKCLEITNELLNSKDYDKMATLMQNKEYYDSYMVVSSVLTMFKKYQPGGALLQKIMQNNYEGIVDTFKTLDPECKVLVAKNFEVIILQQNLVYVSQMKVQNMDQIEMTFKPMKDLLETLKKNL